MLSLPIVVVIASAFLHAGWNIIGKRFQASGPPFFLAACSTASLILSPLVMWYLHTIGWSTLPWTFWLLLLLSCFCQVIYIVGLIYAYRYVDIGIAYPLARGFPVLLVGFGTVALGHALLFQQWLGFSILTLGCVLIPLKSFRQFRLSEYKSIGIVWAFLAALGTAGYSILDKEALMVVTSSVDENMNTILSSMFYLGIQFFGISMLMVFWFFTTNKTDQFIQAWRVRHSAAIAGTMMGLTYGMVLFAMSFTENVSLVVALRQVSIVFGMLMGILFLRERWYYTRGLGVMSIVAGLIIAFV